MDEKQSPLDPITTAEMLASANWPKLELVRKLQLDSRDCIVLAAGFEDRALGGLRLAVESSESFGAVMIRYLPSLLENRDDEIIRLCNEGGIGVKDIIYDRASPSGIGSSLLTLVSRFRRVIVDVSGMSGLLIVQIIVSLVEARKPFDIVYTEAESYPPSQSEYLASHSPGLRVPAFLSSGVIEVVAAPELSSSAMLGGSTRLISFPSFDPSQLSNLVSEVQPTHNDVVTGVPPDSAMAWRTSAINYLNAPTLDSIQHRTIHEVSTFDYRDTLKVILNIYELHSAFDRIIVGPTGSKMQTVGVAILKGFVEDLQVCYPTPRRYLDPARYTHGIRQTYRLSVFGSTDSLSSIGPDLRGLRTIFS